MSTSPPPPGDPIPPGGGPAGDPPGSVPPNATTSPGDHHPHRALDGLRADLSDLVNEVRDGGTATTPDGG